MVPTIQQFSLLCIWVYFGACFDFAVYTGLNSDGAKGVNKAMGLFAFSFITSRVRKKSLPVKSRSNRQVISDLPTSRK